jgi:phage baseplate assembly protein W
MNGVDPFGTDLALRFGRGGDVDLDQTGEGIVSGLDNLRQALTIRLLVDRGELAGLGHPNYGSRIRELLGQRLDRANRELLRRYVRQALLQDPRVADVLEVSVVPHASQPNAVDQPNAVEVLAVVAAMAEGAAGGQVTVGVVFDAG